MEGTEVLKPCESSMFSHIGYDDNTWTLVARYKSTGETRAYKDVSPELADEVICAKSIGSAFNQHIKGRFEHEILGAVEGIDQPQKQETAQQKVESESMLTDDELDLIAPAPKTLEGTLASRKGQPAPQPGAAAAEDYPAEARAAIALPQQNAPQIESIIDQARKYSREALQVTVNDAIEYQSAAETLKILLAARQRAFDFLDPIRDAVYKAYQIVQKRQKEALDPIDTSINHIKRAMATWQMQQERVRQERLRAEREAAEAEARRLQQEQSQQLTLSAVEQAIEDGDQQRAEELMQKPIEAPVPYVAPAHVESVVPKVEGISERKNWKVDKDSADVAELLRAVQAGRYPIDEAAQLLLPNFPALNGLARSMQKTFNVPGFTAFNDAGIATRIK